MSNIEQARIESHIVYAKEIQRDSIRRMIADLDIDIRDSEEYAIEPHHKMVLVDGCKGNQNVTDLIGDEVGVIDHHKVVSPEDVEFSDIRTDYGACASIVGSYFLDLDVEIPRDVATALMIGTSIDSSLLTRGVSEQDLRVYFHCFNIADFGYVTSILRNYIRISDLKYYKYLLDNLEYHEHFAFCFFPNGCSQNLLGILADFVLSFEEISFVVLCAKDRGRVHFSLRSEVPDWEASHVIRDILAGIGFGGGHADMAGGVIKSSSDFDKGLIHSRIISHLGL